VGCVPTELSGSKKEQASIRAIFFDAGSVAFRLKLT